MVWSLMSLRLREVLVGGVVEDLIREGKLVGMEYPGKRFYMRKLPNRL